MPDILIIPDVGKPWVLGLRKGVVVRLPSNTRTGRTYYALNCHGDQTDSPAEIARMKAIYALEERMNA